MVLLFRFIRSYCSSTGQLLISNQCTNERLFTHALRYTKIFLFWFTIHNNIMAVEMSSTAPSNYYADKKKFWNVVFRKRQVVVFSEMKRSVLRTKIFHLQYDSFQIGNEINLFDNEIWCFITIHYQKSCFHCQSETNHIVNENLK